MDMDNGVDCCSNYFALHTYQVKSAIAFFIYNRPHLTQKIFAKIAEVRPRKLFIIADGAKPFHKDQELCKKTREIVDHVPWNCEVVRIYSETNLGCKNRVASGVTEVLSRENEIIILEDDIFPHISFFRYCDELLERYRDQPQIMMIAGTNFFKISHPHYSYFFSRYPGIWGWATWRRAWERYDVDIKDWPLRRRSKDFTKFFINSIEAKIFTTLWDDVYYDNFDTWDYQWDYCRFFSQGIGIIPSENLVCNIGFGEHATHTKNSDNFLAKIPLSSLPFPLIHPQIDSISRFLDYDDVYFRQLLYRPPWKIPLSILKKKVKRFLQQSSSSLDKAKPEC
ncbi:MAG: glycosyltransferase family 2 protein [Oligoflexia bacterium]|nr:glycosyltransferase family 2 protein [Oligoflexia bacterium]